MKILIYHQLTKIMFTRQPEKPNLPSNHWNKRKTSIKARKSRIIRVTVPKSLHLQHIIRVKIEPSCQLVRWADISIASNKSRTNRTNSSRILVCIQTQRIWQVTTFISHMWLTIITTRVYWTARHLNSFKSNKIMEKVVNQISRDLQQTKKKKLLKVTDLAVYLTNIFTAHLSNLD